jgi:choline kinase
MLNRLGLTRIVVVTGHYADQVAMEVNKHARQTPIKLIFNPDYEAGSASSLLAAADEIKNGVSLVMDGDLLIGRDLLDTLVNSEEKNALVADKDHADLDELSKVYVDAEGRVTGLGKGLKTKDDIAGANVGLYRLGQKSSRRLLKELETAVEADPEVDHETVINACLEDLQLFAVPSAGSPWTEINTLEDVDRARGETWPAIVMNEKAVAAAAAG